MPQNTIRLLKELTALGFTDAQFHLIHHMPDVGIARHIQYCEKTGNFRPGSRNMLVQRRLIHVRDALRSSGITTSAGPHVFDSLARAARQTLPG